MIAGSLAATLGAVMIALPIGFASAGYIHFYSSKLLQDILRRSLEILAGIPSVVYGFWGLVVLVPFMNRWHPPGAGLLTAILILAMMILPTAALMIDAFFRSISSQSERGIYSLGLGRWELMTLVVIPSVKKGLITTTLLSTGRALGETMAVLMVCGNIVQVPDHIFDPIRTLTTNIALELGYAEGDHRSALFASGFFLLILTALLIVIMAFVERQEKSR